MLFALKKKKKKTANALFISCYCFSKRTRFPGTFVVLTRRSFRMTLLETKRVTMITIIKRKWYAFQIGENKAVHADGAGKGKSAVVPLSDRRDDVDLAVREHREKGTGHPRLPGRAVLRVFHARDTENNERDAQHDRALRPRRQGSERGRYTQTVVSYPPSNHRSSSDRVRVRRTRRERFKIKRATFVLPLLGRVT